MTLPPDHLRYERRRAGLDHQWFEHRSLYARQPVQWPGGARIALWIVVPIEFFPLDGAQQPFRPVGGLDRPYPDFWGFANREYGHRVGLYRIMRLLDERGLRATAAANSDIAKHYPRLLEELLQRQWEIMASGVNMARLHHGGLSREDERALISESVTTLRAASGQAVAGWHSPGHSQSMHTLALLAEQKLAYVADWINDDLPYEVRTSAGALHALPLTFELSDRKILVQHDGTVEEYEAQVLAAFRHLLAESERHGGRLLSLSVTPWITGYPHRIGALRRILDAILQAGSVWPATGSEVLRAFTAQNTLSRTQHGTT
jgi:peptidoglycan/xylan/chitin deacetylase (PgdA/CDA1 family)